MRSVSKILVLGLVLTLSWMGGGGSALASVGSKEKLTQGSKAANLPKRLKAISRSKPSSTRHAKKRFRSARAELSFGRAYGLHNAIDQLSLKSGVALVVDQDTDEVLFSKNSKAVLPIASLTKLMTAMVVIESPLSLDDILVISQADVDTEKGSRSRLRVGTQLTRGEMLHLALMSSENRAAHALGRSYPGGLSQFVQAMNKKARDLGMQNSRYVEPTGLSSQNQSSAHDLAILVNAAYQHQIIRDLSTSPSYAVDVGQQQLQFRNTNGLISKPDWEIGLQKTGYISEAGRCLVMQARLAGRQLIMIFLDSASKYARIGDAERVRTWVELSYPSAASVVN